MQAAFAASDGIYNGVEISAQNKLIPALKSALILAGSLAHRGRRRSRRWMTERGGCADNAHPVEPREAQRPTSLAARTPIAAILGNGDIAVGAIERTLARSVWGLASPWRLPALHPLVFEGRRKTGIRASGRPKNKFPGKRSVGLPPTITTRSFRTPRSGVPESITTNGGDFAKIGLMDFGTRRLRGSAGMTAGPGHSGRAGSPKDQTPGRRSFVPNAI